MSVLLNKGAEADILLNTVDDRKVIVKRRAPKAYRQRVLDEKIRRYRTIHEAELLSLARQRGISTPIVYFMNPQTCEIFMQYIQGVQLKDYLQNATDKERIHLSEQLGQAIGLLHENGIIHGDITTSNIILTPNRKLCLLDFGLAYHSELLEDQGVELLLLNRALSSFHYQYGKQCYDRVLAGYRLIRGGKTANAVAKKAEEVRRRGRYIEER